MARKKFPQLRRTNPTSSELRLFRSAVSQLKKQGIIKASVDARSARPYFVRGGKTLAEVVNKNRSKLTVPKSVTLPKTLSESPAKPASTNTRKISTPVSVAPSTAKTAAPNLLPKAKKNSIGIRDFPTKAKSLSTVFHEMLKDPAKFDALKNPKEYWGFRIAGTDSRGVYPNVETMIEDAFRYGVGMGPYGSRDVFHNRYKSDQLFDKIELIRWNGNNSTWKPRRRIKKATPGKAAKEAERRRRKK